MTCNEIVRECEKIVDHWNKTHTINILDAVEYLWDAAQRIRELEMRAAAARPEAKAPEMKAFDCPPCVVCDGRMTLKVCHAGMTRSETTYYCCGTEVTFVRNVA